MTATDQADADVANDPPATWWRRHSPHGELPLSSAAAISLHVFVILLLAVGLTWLVPPPPSAPDIGNAFIEGENGSEGDGTSDVAGGGGNEETANSEPADGRMTESTGESDSKPTDTSSPNPRVTDVDNSLPAADATPEANVVEDFRERTRTEIAKSKEAANSIKRKLKERFANGGSGGGSGGGTGSGKGDGDGSGDGGGGGGGGGSTGRGGRQARWVLQFSYSNPKHYLEQIRSLGAALAIPGNGGSMTYYDLSSDPPKPTRQSFNNDDRMYWIDENPGTVDPMSRYLRSPSGQMLILFLPLELERRMTQMELSFQNRREDEIASTLFVVEPKGSGYEVRVKDQQPRR